MSERLFQAAGATTIIGIILLTLYASQLEPPLTSITDVSQDMLETNIRVQAKVCGTHKFDGGSKILKLCENTTQLDAYLPYNTAIHIDEKKTVGKTVELTGTVETYNGRLEIVIPRAENIKIVE
ncbi:MAG TPA: hypothetical protein ENN13_02180 [Candidatus Altiarchaeales archaeon]|nr:hypothetical protein [Candidatus Altiarchaeales archaeon]